MGAPFNERTGITPDKQPGTAMPPRAYAELHARMLDSAFKEKLELRVIDSKEVGAEDGTPPAILLCVVRKEKVQVGPESKVLEQLQPVARFIEGNAFEMFQPPEPTIQVAERDTRIIIPHGARTA